MKFQFFTADVFTDRIFSGNPLAVFPDAAGLNSRQMQLAAREFNLSETAFVLPPEDPSHSFRVRFFTPAVELPFAGHPTIGTAFVLAAIGVLQLSEERTMIILEEGVGLVPVTIVRENGRAGFCQLSAAQLPMFGPIPPSNRLIAEVLSLTPDDLLGEPFQPQAVSCGVPFLFIPLRDRAALARAKIERAIWEREFSHYWATELYPFCFDPELEHSDVRARMFAPAMGIIEDPATGAAATALGGYLGSLSEPTHNRLKWVVEQGFEMGRPSLLEIEVEKDEGGISAIRVGGRAVLVSEGWMEIPN
jgi:trans-2,3-dihydro-3-hydroxyanthranilate isomerase